MKYCPYCQAKENVARELKKCYRQYEKYDYTCKTCSWTKYGHNPSIRGIILKPEQIKQTTKYSTCDLKCKWSKRHVWSDVCNGKIATTYKCCTITTIMIDVTEEPKETKIDVKKLK